LRHRRITPRQIQYWDEIGLVKPSTSAAAGRGTRGDIRSSISFACPSCAR